MYRAICLILTFFLISCSGGSAKSMLGLEKKTPNEFKVLSNPPLSIPPDFSLRPPRKPDLKSAPSSVDLQEELLGISPANPTLSQAEDRLLQKAGASHRDDNIRAILKQDAKTKSQSSSGGWFSDENDTVIIPKETPEKGILEEWLGL